MLLKNHGVFCIMVRRGDGSMKKKILLINCYREKADEKIEGYHGWLRTGAAAAGLDLAVHEVNDRESFPEAGEFSALDRLRFAEDGRCQ